MQFINSLNKSKQITWGIEYLVLWCSFTLQFSAIWCLSLRWKWRKVRKYFWENRNWLSLCWKYLPTPSFPGNLKKKWKWTNNQKLPCASITLLGNLPLTPDVRTVLARKEDSVLPPVFALKTVNSKGKAVNARIHVRVNVVCASSMTSNANLASA